MDPATWIPEPLAGNHLARPRPLESIERGRDPPVPYGHWQLAPHYDFLRVDADGALEHTKDGRDFLKHPGGETEAVVDEGESLVKLLIGVANNGPVWHLQT